MPHRRAALPALLVTLAVLGAACGGGGGGGGGGDLATEAAETEALMDRLEALPEVETLQQFQLELSAIRDELQQQIQDVASADAPDELAPQRERLASRLRELRTQLGRVNAAVAAGDVETASTIVENLSSVEDVRGVADTIQGAG